MLSHPVPPPSRASSPPLPFSVKAGEAMRLIQEQYALLKPDHPALIGVSGGRDSVALLHWLHLQGWRQLIVCHFNHALRGRESGQDAIAVRRLAERYGFPYESQRLEIAALAASRKASVETTAREERSRFFKEVAHKHGSNFVFLAHHADDQAETILAHLCRGGGLRGLAGMAPASLDPAGLVRVRPLLQVSRDEVTAYIRTHVLRYREDSSNAEREYRRNRLRHEALPLLSDIFQRDVSATLVRAGLLAARDEEFLEGAALSFLEQKQLLLSDGALRITPELRALPAPVLSRVLRHWLEQYLRLPSLPFQHLEEAMKLLSPTGPSKINLPADRWLRRRAGKLFVEPPPR